MATFVLVHGAMHGGWCWRAVADRLSAAGHDVHRPTLTGQGERRAALTPDVGVATHVRDLTELLWFEDLSEVDLVLHSYAGVLAGPVAEQAGERVRAVVWLGAFVTGPGQSLLDVEPADTVARYRQLATAYGDGWRVPASDAFLDQWGITDDASRSVAAPRLTDFPLRCATDPTDYDPAPLARLRRTYIAHTDPPLDSLERSARAASEAGAAMLELRAGHDMMLTAPAETAQLLVGLTAR